MQSMALEPRRVSLVDFDSTYWMHNNMTDMLFFPGRILIMTTNHIETLDKALIRTGRADVIVTFTNVTKKQAVEMFINIYSGERWIPYQPGKPDVEDWTEDDIKRLADEFGAKIHDQTFSPALLQQYFKEFRVEPRRAVQEIDKWMEDPRGYRKHGIPKQRLGQTRSAENNPPENNPPENDPLENNPPENNLPEMSPRGSSPPEKSPAEKFVDVEPDSKVEVEISQKNLSLWDFFNFSS